MLCNDSGTTLGYDIKKSFDNKYWNRIQGISFFLAVFVVIRHNSSYANYQASDPYVSVARVVHEAFQNSITQVAVPLFFIIAGFNFFKNYSPRIFKKKIKNRILSLVVPYLTWNCIYMVYNIVISTPAISQYFIGREKFNISLWNVIYGCIYHWKCNSQFWFVFNLILFSLINYGAFYALHNIRMGVATLFFLYICIFMLRVELPIELIYRTDSFFYYYLGAFAGLQFSDKVIYSCKFEKRALWGVLLLSSTCVLLFQIPYPLQPIFILIGCTGIWWVSFVWQDNENRFPSGGTTFLIYAAHGIIQPITVKLLFIIFPKYGFISTINSVLSVMLTVTICILLRKILRNYMPTLDRLLTGWRR